MIKFTNFYQLIANNHLSHWLETLPAQIATLQNCLIQKQFKKKQNIIKFLPIIKPDQLDLVHSVTANSNIPISSGQKLCIKNLMKNLMPWRKGPFFLYDLHIDTEWRSDWKWQRILPYLSNLNGRIILDVGSGNGYYLWRMLGAGARLAIGIDKTQLFLYQFEAIRKLLGNDQRAHVLPIDIKQLPALNAFDTVSSLGVLCHSKSPLEHLQQLKNQLITGGELVLETLVIDGNETNVLVCNHRYAKMKNIYFIPSALALKSWLQKCGFIDVHIVNTCVTSIKEQRRTAWMTSQSLSDFLDPNDATKTIEGYPAPMRAVLIAKKP